MKISLILAKSKNNAIGLNNSLLWHLPKDFKHFKDTTIHRANIMGRKTFESLPSPLKDRLNIVLTSSDFEDTENVKYRNNVIDALDAAIQYNKIKEQNEIMIIGGSEIYDLFFPLVDKLYITDVDVDLNGDAFFNCDLSRFKLIQETFHPKDDKHIYDMSIKVYEKL